MGDRVGKAGIEAEYDRFLRGRNGAARVEVDALGKLTKTLKRRAAAPGPAAAAVARPERAARGAAGARRRHREGRLRGDERAERRGAGARLAAVVRPEHLLQADQPEEAGRAQLGRARQAAVRPRDPGRLSHGLHLQADHRDRRAPERADHAVNAAQRPGLAHGRRHQVRERRRHGARRALARAGAHGLERRLLLPAGPRPEREGHAAPAVGAPARHRSQNGDRPAGREPRRASDAEMARPLSTTSRG